MHLQQQEGRPEPEQPPVEPLAAGAQEAPANAVIRVTAPEPIQAARRGLAWLGVGVAATLLLGALFWLSRNPRGLRLATAPRSRESASEALVAQIAALDAQFERAPGDRAAYDARRAELKAQLTHALAAEKEQA